MCSLFSRFKTTLHVLFVFMAIVALAYWVSLNIVRGAIVLEQQRRDAVLRAYDCTPIYPPPGSEAANIGLLSPPYDPGHP